ncbi:L-threonylcarbamoyladenylate synthase [Scytonema millei]|uniref:L-threonylcarbamoyladenylate synthase n=1 Tax=Scytonema millei VB511283 TaxID=1245923 RepID=A0A9X5I6G2_9CYAN|nr:L-threonylcarbamoyladenylate synthase [Scytonema millei]NHC36497.1 L-threonylcarbamoyladenylate synthase [Scytonema millei VB511283]
MPQVSITELVAGVRAGCVVSFPTDTVPALAALPERAELIFATKQRSQDKPLILMGAKAEDVWDYVVGTEADWQVWQQVAARYWAGALTLVLPASDRVPKAMNPTDPTTIGVRVPQSAIAREILAQTGPLATTSANLSGQPPLETMTEIAAQFPDVLSLQISDVSGIGVPSTVAKWMGSGWVILRQGAVVLEI